MRIDFGKLKTGKGKIAVRAVLIVFVGICILGGKGGIKFMSFFVFGLLCFLAGKYVEKLLMFIKDYRLSKKLDRINYSQIEIDNMKKQLEEYKNIIIGLREHGIKGRPPSGGRGYEAPGRGIGPYKVPSDIDEMYEWEG